MPDLLTRERLEGPINAAIAEVENKYTIEARAIAQFMVHLALIAQAEALEVAAEKYVHSVFIAITYTSGLDKSTQEVVLGMIGAAVDSMRAEAARLRKEAE